MQQLIHIHGGDVHDSYEAYLAALQAQTIDNPREEKTKKWRDRYEELLGDDWLVIRPQMPSALNAKYSEWVLWFEKYLPYLEANVVLVGHSLGATFLAKYLSERPLPVSAQSLHLVAPAFACPGGFSLDDTVSAVAERAEVICLYHSTDDEIVPYEASVRLAEHLPTAEFVTFTDRNHFLQPEFPELIARIKRLAG
jgi:hypothetical protein